MEGMGKENQRVDGDAVYLDSQMQVRGGAASGASYQSQGGAAPYGKPGVDQCVVEVPVQTLDPLSMIDDDQVAEERIGAGEGDVAAVDADDQVAGAPAQVDPLVQACAHARDWIDPPAEVGGDMRDFSGPANERGDWGRIDGGVGRGGGRSFWGGPRRVGRTALAGHHGQARGAEKGSPGAHRGVRMPGGGAGGKRGWAPGRKKKRASRPVSRRPSCLGG